MSVLFAIAFPGLRALCVLQAGAHSACETFAHFLTLSRIFLPSSSLRYLDHFVRPSTLRRRGHDRIATGRNMLRVALMWPFQCSYDVHSEEKNNVDRRFSPAHGRSTKGFRRTHAWLSRVVRIRDHWCGAPVNSTSFSKDNTRLRYHSFSFQTL